MIQLIPTPKRAEFSRPLKYVEIPARIHSADPAHARLLAAFCDYALRLHNVPFEIAEGGIEVTAEAFDKPDAYRLTLGRTSVVSVSGLSGLSHALASLLQLLVCRRGIYLLPEGSVLDWPEASYRGLMVDLARKFHEFPKVLEFVDLCFLYKINRLQLHFCDTQSYTLPSKLLPKAPTPDRHYTFEQISQLVEYARDRQVELIPEFETPGHSDALISAYPEIFAVEPDRDAEGFLINGVAVNHSIVCVGRREARETTFRLLDELMQLFPYSKEIHLGGDEANIALWDTCPLCRSYREEKGLSGVKALYAEWVGEVADYVISAGRTPIVWEGFPKENAARVSRKTRVIAWESYYNPAPSLLEDGFELINCSWQPLYITPGLRWTPEDILRWDIYRWQHWWEQSQAYLNDIVVPGDSPVAGAQLCVWECTYEEEIDCLRRNLAALSEKTWTVRRVISDAQFAENSRPLLSAAEKLAQTSAV